MHIRRFKAAAVAIASLLVATVASMSFVGPASARAAEAFITPRCPVTAIDRPVGGDGSGRDATPLTGLLVQMIITKGIDMVGTAMTEAAKDKVTPIHVPPSETMQYYTMAPDASLGVSKQLGCVVLISRGSAPGLKPAWVERLRKNAVDLKMETAIDTAPDFYFEAELRRNASSATLYVTPVLLYVRSALLEGQTWFRKAEKDYVVTLSFLNAANDAAFGAATFAFKNVRAGTPVVRQGLDQVKEAQELAGWPARMAIPALPVGQSLLEAQGRQKTQILPYQQANAAIKRASAPPLERAPIETDTAYMGAVDKLCVAIAAQNSKGSGDAKTTKADMPASLASDPRCPYPVWTAKLNADKVATEVNASQTLQWANRFQQAKCKDSDGKLPATGCGLPQPANPEVGDFQVAANVVETADAIQFVKVVASAFEQQKAALTTQLNDRLNPVRRDELDAAEETGARDKRQKLQLALLKVEQLEASHAEAAGSSASARKAVEIQLVQAKMDANAAARSSGSASPYPDHD